MKTLSDSDLLGEYARHNSQDAFAELVQRYVDLVYSTALRQVGGDAHLAQDVAQNVFTALARKARGLLRRRTLSGWFYTSARFAGAEVVRAESRRRIREEQFMREPTHEPASEPDWETVSPLLDAAMGELREKDREAILLRYFEDRAYAEVGQRLGLNENAARMRVERALDNLRAGLARRGLAVGAGLGAAIATNAVQVAPSGLAATLTAGSLAASGAGTFAFLELLTTAKVNLGLVALALAGATTIGLVAYQQPGTRTVLQQPTVSVAGKSEFAASVQGNNNTAAIPSAQPGPPRAQPLESVSLPSKTPAPESLLVVGNQSDNVVQFDIATGRWSELARLPKGSGPRGIAVSDAGKLYLSLERGSKNLVELVPGESAPQLKDVSRPIGRYGPGILVYSKGQIWTAGDTERLIYRVDPTTGEVTTPPQFQSPFNIVGFTMDGDTLYAGEYFQRGIARYEMGTETKPTVRLVTNDVHLDKPVGLTIGHNGNLYVASRLEPAVVEFDLQTGAYVRTLVDLGVGSKEGVYGLVYAPATRRYYISAGSNIYEVDPDGKLLATYNSPALKSANAIALLPSGVHLALTQPAASAPALAASHAITLLKAVPGKLIITGERRERCRVLATTDFLTWEPIASLRNTNGTVEYIDPDAHKFDRRFYRLEMLTE
jgi:RNA polymerase sigma factor (sigma-70 family)